MLRTCGPVIAVALLLGACGGGGDAMPAPHDLHYALGTGQVGSPYGPYPPTDSGTVTGYSVSPALPAGLTLDPTSGVISGTPVAVSSGTYTVTASDAAGAATAALTLVIQGPLTAVTYTSPVTATVGAAFTPLVPTLSGHADSFTVFPPLPAGLTLDPVTGIVSGTPTSARPAFTYSIAASNVYGSSVAALLLTVDPPPGSLRARRARTAVEVRQRPRTAEFLHNTRLRKWRILRGVRRGVSCPLNRNTFSETIPYTLFRSPSAPPSKPSFMPHVAYKQYMPYEACSATYAVKGI